MKRTVSNVSQIATPSDAHGGPLWLPLGNDKAPHGLHLNRAKFSTKRVWQLRSMRWTVRVEILELHLPHLPVVVNVHRTSYIIYHFATLMICTQTKRRTTQSTKVLSITQVPKSYAECNENQETSKFLHFKTSSHRRPPETTCCPKQGVGAMMISGSNIPSFGDQHLQCLQITIPGSTSGHSQIPDFTQ